MEKIVFILFLIVNFPLINRQEKAIIYKNIELFNIWGTSAGRDTPADILFNPALSINNSKFSIAYYHTDVGLPGVIKNGEGDSIIISSKIWKFGVNTSFQLLYPSLENTKKDEINNKIYNQLFLKIGTGNSIKFNSLSLGFTVNNIFSLPGKHAISIDLGILWRPNNYFSLGIAGRNINAAKIDTNNLSEIVQFQRIVEVSTAFRPLQTDQLQLDIRALLSEFTEESNRLLLTYQITSNPIQGLQIGFRLSHNLQFNQIEANLLLGITFHKITAELLTNTSLKNKNIYWNGWSIGIIYDKYRTNSIIKEENKIIVINISKLTERKVQIITKKVSTPLLDKVLLIDKIKSKDNIRGVLIIIGEIESEISKIEELRRELQKLKEKNKKIYAYLTSGSLKSYYLASVANKIFMHPASSLWFQPIKAEFIFFKKLFDKIGITPQFVKLKKYKTAPNIYTNSSPTKQQIEIYQMYLADLYTELKKSILKSRKINEKRLEKIIEEGIITPERAKKLQLIEDYLFWDKIEESIKRDFKEKVILTNTALDNNKNSWYPKGKKIAIIYIDGTIISGSDYTIPFLNSKFSGSNTVIKYLLKALYNPSIKAVVLRIDSPGGEVFASEQIAHYIKKLKEKKPVVVSMSSTAASGAYYIAAVSDKVFALNTTVTGSIGIFAGKFDFSRLLANLGINSAVLEVGKGESWFSPYKPWSHNQIKILKKYLYYKYKNFLKTVSKGRNLAIEKVEKIAQGKIWSGKRAVANGLVDKIGGILDAIKMAKKLAKIGREEPIQLIIWPKYNPVISIKSFESLKNIVKKLSKAKVWAILGG